MSLSLFLFRFFFWTEKQRGNGLRAPRSPERAQKTRAPIYIYRTHTLKIYRCVDSVTHASLDPLRKSLQDSLLTGRDRGGNILEDVAKVTLKSPKSAPLGDRNAQTTIRTLDSRDPPKDTSSLPKRTFQLATRARKRERESWNPLSLSLSAVLWSELGLFERVVRLEYARLRSLCVGPPVVGPKKGHVS